MSDRGNSNRVDRTALALGCVITLGLVVVLGRVAQLQIAPGPQLLEFVSGRNSGQRLQATRGDLLDRRGRVLSTSRFGYRTIVDPTRIEPELDRVIVELAEVLGLPTDEVGAELVGRLEINDDRQRRRRDMGLDLEIETKQVSLLALLRTRLGLGQTTAAEETTPVDTTGAPQLSRYVPIGPTLELEQAEAVRARKLPGVWLERVPVREYPGGDSVASLLGKVGFGDRTLEHTGLMGAERIYDSMLDGEDGRLGYVRDAKGRPLWVEQGAWRDSESGRAVRLSLDLEIQQIAREELTRGVEAADAAGGRLVVLDPRTGEVLAICDLYRDLPDAQPFPWRVKDEEGLITSPMGTLAPDPRDRPRYVTIPADEARLIHPALGRNRCVEDVYEPGSTFKSFMWSAAKEAGYLPADEIVHTGGKRWRTPYGRIITDVYPKGGLTWDEVLLHSSNIGMAQLAERVPPEVFQDAIARFGLGSKTGIGLPGETAGLVTSAKNWNKYTQTSVAMGYEVGVTPVQMVRAFSALARVGDLAGTLPDLRLTAAGEDDRPGIVGDPLIVRRAIDPGVAQHVRTVLAGVASRMDDRMQKRFPDEAPPSYAMFGKSGTTEISLPTPAGKARPRGFNGYLKNQHYSSFLAAAPADDPRLVVIVVIDDPGPALVRTQQHYGSWVAGPVVRRVMERTLRYLGVPPDEIKAELAAAGG